MYNVPFSKEKEILEKLGAKKKTVAYFTHTDNHKNVVSFLKNGVTDKKLKDYPENPNFNPLKYFCEETGMDFDRFFLSENFEEEVCFVSDLFSFNSHLTWQLIGTFKPRETDAAILKADGSIDKEFVSFVAQVFKDFEEQKDEDKDFENYVNTLKAENRIPENYLRGLETAMMLMFVDQKQAKFLKEEGALESYIRSQELENGYDNLLRTYKAQKKGLYDLNIPKEEYYNVWRLVYQASRLDYHLLLNLLDEFYDKDNPEVKSRLERLSVIADEKGYIEIYRGFDNDSNSLDKAKSWSLSENVACSFANRYFSADNEYGVARGKVHISDIIDTFVFDTFLMRNELEVLVNPSKVTIEEIYKVPSIRTILKTISEYNIDSMITDGEDDMTSITNMYGLGKGLLDLMNNISVDSYDEELFLCSDLHGMSHTKRVILNTLIVALLHREELNLSGEDFNILLAAAMFHDIGRENDEEDYVHGQASVEKIEDRFRNLLTLYMGFSEEEIEIIYFLMANHNIPDDLAYENLKKSNLENQEHVWKLYSVLTDGDNLERVRLRDLNIGYLRNRYSKLLLPLAESMLQNVE